MFLLLYGTFFLGRAFQTDPKVGHTLDGYFALNNIICLAFVLEWVEGKTKPRKFAYLVFNIADEKTVKLLFHLHKSIFHFWML